MELSEDTMYQASLQKDPSFEGVFWMGVKTTGIFCRPTCRARKPKRQNVEFFFSAKSAMLKGYRPCKVCTPLENPDATPKLYQQLISELLADPSLKLRDQDLRARQIDPTAIRRYFQKQYGMSFHSFQRTLRINSAFKKLQDGESIPSVALESGYESLSGFTEAFKNLYKVSPSQSATKTRVELKRLETPLGTMVACSSARGICLLEFSDRWALETELKDIEKRLGAQIVVGESPLLQALEKELSEYFEGVRTEFSVPLDPIGTDFQKQVWEVLRGIPYGTVVSYQKQAQILGSPKAVRAVALANGKNKISILIPCHRVIGLNGHLTGYGGGIWRKQKLLELEKAILL